MASTLPWFGKDRCPLYLAPMAGFTDIAFRQLCKTHGADVMVTEFVQSEPLIRDVARTWHAIDFTEAQRPMGLQIFGATPESMAKAARLLEERLRPDFIDINFGCPAHNVVEQNAGAGLLRCPELLQDIVEAVIQAVERTPITAKMRLGWDRDHIVAVDVARRLEDAGVCAIAVHGRTKVQGYSGEADWDEIAKVASSVRVPVIGNGDIRNGEMALKRYCESGVAGLMIGRAALGNPWLFAEIKAALRGEALPDVPSDNVRWDMLLDYARILMSQQEHSHRIHGGDVRWMLTRLHPFTHQLPGSRKLRARLSSCRTLEEICALADECRR
ncbi:MAG: tRNA dihydrouridine synthase DusB [Puniceicoccales bacterium]|jgi:nifR3 family TIM-barrel protein|nr:tRNA dihydrouridine synthase DusB [Puniceicoccales bacterium]